MLGVKYFKAEPTEFARIRVNGKVKKEGEGISGFYIPFRTTIETVPLTASDQPFTFREISKDNQDVSLQGGFVYRIEKPTITMSQYNFSINPDTRQYLTEDNKKLTQYILQLIRENAKGIAQTTPLEDLLVMGEQFSERLFEKLAGLEKITGIGIELKTLYFESVRPNPEIAKALEANYRESLLQKADESIYARRAKAVEKERTIKENEMKTEIDMEEKRKELVTLKGENTIKTAEDAAKASLVQSKSNAEASLLQGDARAKNILVEGDATAQAIKKEIDAYTGVNPGIIGARALYEFAKNVKQIGDITITPEILATIGSIARFVKNENR